MQIVHNKESLTNKIREYKSKGNKITLIPTMGNLHEGHLKLIKYAQEKDQFLVVSIYVNPLQFDSMMDYKRYPRTIKRDLKILEKLNVDIIFLPENNFSKDVFKSLKLGECLNKILIDPKATMFLLGSVMDYREDKLSSRFVFDNPNEKSTCGCGESFSI